MSRRSLSIYGFHFPSWKLTKGEAKSRKSGFFSTTLFVFGATGVYARGSATSSCKKVPACGFAFSRDREIDAGGLHAGIQAIDLLLTENVQTNTQIKTKKESYARRTRW